MKAVVFDFDGTLTYKSPNIWKAIWKSLGYEIGVGSYFANLYVSFISKDITHKQWCDLTCDAFIEKGLTKSMVEDLTKQITLHEGVEEVFKTLTDLGYSIHIVSGSVDTVIKEVLGDSYRYFSDHKSLNSINANKFEYNKKGVITKIIGTNYDFEGKAKFIEELKEKNGIEAKDIVFVGNGDNDEWAHLSGCKTICINPENTNGDNKEIWHSVINDVTNLQEVLPSIIDNDM